MLAHIRFLGPVLAAMELIGLVLIVFPSWLFKFSASPQLPARARYTSVVAGQMVIIGAAAWLLVHLGWTLDGFGVDLADYYAKGGSYSIVAIDVAVACASPLITVAGLSYIGWDTRTRRRRRANV